jgi:hypothetical protein
VSATIPDATVAWLPFLSGRAGCGTLSLDAVRDVACHGDRTQHFAFVAFDDSEGHLDVEFASAFVQRPGQRRTALKLHYALCHRRVEAAPVRSAQMLRNDQVETSAECFLREEAKQTDRSAIPSDNFARSVRVDDGIGKLIDNSLSQEPVFHG